MPEWPDRHVVRGRIAAALVGRRIVAVRIGDPVVLRATRPVDELLVGRRLDGVRHRGKFLIFDFADAATMVVQPMLSGMFALVPAGSAVTKDTRLRLEFAGGDELRYRDEVRMGKIYLELERLHRALGDVIARAVEAVEGAMPPALGTKPRDHLRIRGRAGTPCPRCGATLKRRRSGLNDVDLCPHCQPPPKGQLF